jgi:hypothetical protein
MGAAVIAVAIGPRPPIDVVRCGTAPLPRMTTIQWASALAVQHPHLMLMVPRASDL